MGRSIANALVLIILSFGSFGLADEINNFNFEKHVEKVKDPNHQNVFVATLMTWGEHSTLSRSSDSKTFAIQSSTIAGAVAYRSNTITDKGIFSWEAGFVLGQANHESEDASLPYMKSSAGLVGGYINPCYLIEPEAGKTKIGISLPVFYRSMQFELPDQDYVFKQNNEILPYVGLEVSWRLFPRLDVIQKLAHSLSGDETMWMASLGVIL